MSQSQSVLKSLDDSFRTGAFNVDVDEVPVKTGAKLNFRAFAYMSYAIAAYVVGMGALIYFIGFLINAYVPKGIDTDYTGEFAVPIFINSIVITSFFLIHSIMARPWFKRWWIKMIPAPLERSTYLMISGSTIFLLVYLWQPLALPVWTIVSDSGRGILFAIYLTGWITMTLATFNIDHVSFFGLRQAWASIQNKVADSPGFSATYLYRLVRHPISTCWIVVMWVTPDMTVGHLLLASIATIYILIVTPIEERDLREEIGEPYLQYSKQVRRYIPIPKRLNRQSHFTGGNK